MTEHRINPTQSLSKSYWLSSLFSLCILLGYQLLIDTQAQALRFDSKIIAKVHQQSLLFNQLTNQLRHTVFAEDSEASIRETGGLKDKLQMLQANLDTLKEYNEHLRLNQLGLAVRQQKIDQLQLFTVEAKALLLDNLSDIETGNGDLTQLRKAFNTLQTINNRMAHETDDLAQSFEELFSEEREHQRHSIWQQFVLLLILLFTNLVLIYRRSLGLVADQFREVTSIDSNREALIEELQDKNLALERAIQQMETNDQSVAEQVTRILQQKHYLEAILNNDLTGIIAINRYGIVNLFNRRAETIFGYGSDEVINRNIKMLMPAPFRDEHDGYMQRYQTTGEARVIGISRQVIGLKKSGESLHLMLRISEFETAEGLQFVGFIDDLTESKTRQQPLP